MSYSLSLKFMPQSESKLAGYEKVDEVLEVIAGFGLTYVIGASETTITSADLAPLFTLLAQLDEVAQRTSPKGFTFLANLTYSSESQEIDEKRQRVERFQNPSNKT